MRKPKKPSTTRAGRDIERREAKRRKQKRESAQRRRTRETAEKAKRRGPPAWRRPHDLPRVPQDRQPITAEQGAAIRMEPAPAAPAKPVMPPAPAPEPEPESGVDPAVLARDKVRCDKAVAEAIEKDERTMQKLMARNPDEAPCRVCGEPDGLREHCWVCERCCQSRAWPFGNDPCPVDFYDPTIHAILDARTRRAATKTKSTCSVEGCGNKVPTPEGIREDATCDRCYGILMGDARLDRRAERL